MSIIIPMRDRIDLIRRCLASIKMRTRYPDYEVLIIDNGSTEPAAKAAERTSADFKSSTRRTALYLLASEPLLILATQL